MTTATGLMAGTIANSYSEVSELTQAAWSCPTGSIERAYTLSPDGDLEQINMLADTDGDSLSDALELFLWGDLTTSNGNSGSNSTDNDGDDLSDYEEWLAGSDPTSDESIVGHAGPIVTTNSITPIWNGETNWRYRVQTFPRQK